MGLHSGHAVGHRHQGVELCCWLTALEMLTYWRHHCIYGVDKDNKLRSGHTKAVLEAYRRNRGYSISECAK
jgi:hypothetical protein